MNHQDHVAANERRKTFCNIQATLANWSVRLKPRDHNQHDYLSSFSRVSAATPTSSCVCFISRYPKRSALLQRTLVQRIVAMGVSNKGIELDLSLEIGVFPSRSYAK